jgi:hypothetical protein
MNGKRIAFFALTGLFCLGMAPGAVMDIVQPEMVTEVIEVLGIPPAMLVLIGVWKLLGIVALLQGKFEKLAEWAYAGFVFDLTGAAFLHGAAGDPASAIITPLVFLIPMGISYALRPHRKKVAEAA